MGIICYAQRTVHQILPLVVRSRAHLCPADLEDISGLDLYIARAMHILIFCSAGYFQSKNCMTELRASVATGKSIITLMEPEHIHGGLTKDAVREQLNEADGSYSRWGFVDNGLKGEDLFAALFGQEKPIEWNRIGWCALLLYDTRMLHPRSPCTSFPPCAPCAAASRTSQCA